MIFSFLKIRKKNTGIFVGILVGGLCLWAIASWQNLTLGEMLNILLGTVIMLGGIMLAAFLLIAVFKLLGKLPNRVTDRMSATSTSAGETAQDKRQTPRHDESIFSPRRFIT